MNAYFYVLSFLAFLVLILDFNIRRFRSGVYTKKAISTYAADANKLQMATIHKHFQLLNPGPRADERAGAWMVDTDPQEEPNARPETYPMMRPLVPRNARLNLAALMLEDSAYKQAIENLIENLYGESNFYKKALDTWASPAQAIVIALEELLTKSLEEGKFKELKLSNLQFEDLALNRLWYRMVKGSLFKGDSYPSLLRHLYLVKTKNPRLNVVYASSTVMSAFFGKEVAKEIAEKEGLWVNQAIENEDSSSILQVVGTPYYILTSQAQEELIQEVLGAYHLNYERYAPFIDYTTEVKKSRQIRVEVGEEGPWQDLTLIRNRPLEL